MRKMEQTMIEKPNILPISYVLNISQSDGRLVPYDVLNETFSNVTLTRNGTSELSENNGHVDDLNGLKWALVVLYTLTFLVGLTGNALVCFAVWRNKNMRTVTNIFLVNLAAADLGVIIICLPPALLADVTGMWYLGTVFCKIHLFLSTVTIAVSVMTLCAISVERWYAICHPLKFHSTVQRARIIIIVIWSIAVSVALPEGISAIVVMYGENGTTQSMCYPGMLTENQIQILQIFLMITFYFIPLCLMGYMYISIAIVLSKKRIPGINYKDKRLTDGKLSDVNDQTEGRRKAARMLVAVVILFAICFLPLHSLNIIRYTVGLEAIPYVVTVALLAHWVMFFNSCVNPILYNFFSGKFRKEFKLALQLCLSCRRKEEYRNSEGLRMTLYSGRSTAVYKYTSNRRPSPGYRTETVAMETVQIQDKVTL